MSEPSLSDELAEQIGRLLERTCTRDLILSAEAGQWPERLWSELQDLGLPLAAAPESAGGYGLPWEALSGVLQALGAHAAPVPLAETMVAAWLLGRAGAAIPEGPIVLAPEPLELGADGRVTGRSDDVAWPGQGDLAVAVARSAQGDKVCLLRAPAQRPSGASAAVDWADWSTEFVSEPQPGLAFQSSLAALAVARSAQIAGALTRALGLTSTYAADRKQFGQPLAKFQAVQHLVARLAIEAAAATAAAEFGLRSLEQDPILAAAVAKARTSRAAGDGAAFAHQVHGAIGVTQEHDLQLFTRRLWLWREQAGSEHEWMQRLGAEAIDGRSGPFWPALIDRVSAASRR